MAGRVLTRLVAASILSFGMAVAATPPAASAATTPCAFIRTAVFDAPGVDSVMPDLNGEWVEVANRCARTLWLKGYRIHDLGSTHRYRFPAGFHLDGGTSVRIHSGTGENTATDLFWGRSSGSVWNNRPPERAYLVDRSGTTISTWTWPRARVVWRGPATERTLALTIDDGYNVTVCRQLFDILMREHIAATFFPVSDAVGYHPSFWREVAAAGFPIGNHSVNHPSLPSLSIGRQYDQISRARTRIEAKLGIHMLRALRPPYGAYDTDTRRAATAAGFRRVVTWDASFDDTSRSATLSHQIAAALHVRNGSVVLMHCNKETPAILEAVIPVYRARGYTFVTIGQMFGLEGSVPQF